MDFISAAKSSSGSQTEWLKLEGTKRLRIVSEVERFTNVWAASLGKGYKLPDDFMFPNNLPAGVKDSKKFLCYVLDRTDDADGVLSKVELPQSVINQIGKLASDKDYAFTRFPDYDLKITKEGTGMKTRYTVLPAPNKDPLTPELQEQVDSVDIVELVKGITTKGLETWNEDFGTHEFDKFIEQGE